VSLDFTALDFETANAFRGSPCSVGLVKVRNGEVVAEAETLVRPPAAFSEFDGFNTALHGIDADMVATSPTWPQIRDWIVDWIDGDIVVCHNAGFDIGVIRYACMADGLPWPTMRFFCTLVAARRAYRLLSYRLPFVCAECGVTLVNHHRASDDADAAARIAVAMARLQDTDSLEDLALLLIRK
jgi:DNA polymerase-3 subunit epsilon